MLCTICPRRCKAERDETHGGGVCGMPAVPYAARAALHRWEEPCISGTRGAGTVFFSGCNLGCVFCQNEKISHENFGTPVSTEKLCAIFDALHAQGAHNIDLVSPTQFTPWVLQALRQWGHKLPIVWNSGGYELAETLRTLSGEVDVYLPDLKYALPAPAREFSHAEDYFPAACEAIGEMFRQVGPCRFDETGLLTRGVVIRHLMLPGQLPNTRAVIDWVAGRFAPGEVLFSLMRQYTPQPNAQGVLARRVTGAEYRAATAYMAACGLEGYTQEANSAEAAYTPAFDLTGV